MLLHFSFPFLYKHVSGTCLKCAWWKVSISRIPHKKILKKNDPNTYLLCRWEHHMQDHRLGMSILHGAVWVWGKADVLGNVLEVTVAPDWARANAVLTFCPNILPEALLSLWPLFYCLVSLRNVLLHSRCNCPFSICGRWWPSPQHPFCLTTQNSTFYLSSGQMSETPDISVTLCHMSSVLSFSYPSWSRWKEGAWGMEYSRCKTRSTE